MRQTEQYSNWYKGTPKEWEALSLEEREALAFAGTGCLCAWPRWQAPVDCVHPKCQISRGEKPAIYLTNCILKAEAYNGWLRFNDRQTNAKIFRVYRNAARKTGIYDPWKLGWEIMVGSAIQNA